MPLTLDMKLTDCPLPAISMAPVGPQTKISPITHVLHMPADYFGI